MHLYLQFNGRFTKKADRVARIFAERHGFNRFSGVSTSEGHARWLLKEGRGPVQYHHVFALPQLWREALQRGTASAGRIRELENRYGNLSRFIIADRNLGHTFLTGTVLPDTEMRRRTASHDAVLSCVQALFDYFERRFAEDRPDLVFFQVVASAPAIIASAVCGELGIPFLTLGKTKLDDRHHVASNALMQPDAAINRYADGALEVTDASMARVRECRAEPVASDHFAADRANFRARHGRSVPGLLWDQMKSLPAAIRRQQKPYAPDPRAATPLETWKWETRVKLNYRRYVNAGLFDRQKVEGDYVFFALSVTPEASTCVVAPNFADQLVVISALARSIPSGWKLVVKDHLPMCGRRTRGFYDQVTQYQNVVLVDPTLRSTELIRSARLTVVIAGTSTWEAMLMGKPALALGPAWYLATGLGVYSPYLEELREAILRAIEVADSFSAEERERRCARMTQALLDTSFPFNYEFMWSGFDDKKLNAGMPVFEELAAQVYRRFVEVREAPPHPFDTSGWTQDRTPPKISPR